MIQLINKNCIEGLLELPDNSIDCIFTSPPYKNEDNYSDELISALFWITALKLKPNGLMFLNFGQLAEDPTRFLKVGCPGAKSKLELGPVIAWVKSMPELGGHFKPLGGTNWLNRKWEPVYIFSKTSERKLKRLDVGVPYNYKPNIKRRGHKKDLQCPGDVWFIPYPTRQGAKDHPDEMPVELPRRCLRLAGVTRKSLVVDPFCGSGTTGVAAKVMGASFIGFETNSKHIALAKGRLFGKFPTMKIHRA